MTGQTYTSFPDRVRKIAPALIDSDLDWEWKNFEIRYSKRDGISLIPLVGILMILIGMIRDGSDNALIGFGIFFIFFSKTTNRHGIANEGVFAWKQAFRSQLSHPQGGSIKIPLSSIDPGSVRIHLPRFRFMRIQYAESARAPGAPKSLQLLIMTVFARKAVSFTGLSEELIKPLFIDTSVFHEVGKKYAHLPPESLRVRDCPELLTRWYVHTNEPEKFVKALEEVMVRQGIRGARRMSRQAIANPIIGPAPINPGE
ncbi:MAG: hypothetical protein HOQ05_01190 [Corynebacteriales bacterium]|nr:hypothetical protein [Mycobacteriales bacterium]